MWPIVRSTWGSCQAPRDRASPPPPRLQAARRLSRRSSKQQRDFFCTDIGDVLKRELRTFNKRPFVLEEAIGAMGFGGGEAADGAAEEAA